MSERIAAVLPTYRRAQALRENLASMLQIEGVAELIVVLDAGRDDDAQALLEAAGDSRIVVQPKIGGPGLPEAKNQGAASANAEWVLFLEDDCRYPPDFALTLLGEAAATNADIVGAPWLHLGADEVPSPQVRPSSAPTGGAITLDSSGVVPAETTETPFLPACCLVSRQVLDAVRFDSGYGGNAYREETDFFVRATRLGFTCVLTPRTFFYQVDQWSGGARLPRVSYEYWVLRNNWRFLRHHGEWLANHGYITGPRRYQLRFAATRVCNVVAGAVAARAETMRLRIRGAS